MQVVEFLGVPGAGKSTVADALSEAVPGAVSLGDAVRDSIGRRGGDPITRVAARLTRSPSSRLWSAAYARSTDRLSALIRFASARPDFLESVLVAQRQRGGRDVRPDLVLGWIVNLMARYQLATEYGGAGWLVVDEGFAQRAVALLAAGYEQSDEPALRAYLDASPRPDVLVVVESSLNVCVARLDRRGWSERVARAKETDRQAFLEGCAQMVSLICTRSAEAGLEVISVSGEDPVTNSVSRIAATLAV